MYLNHDGMDEVVNTKTSFQHREPGIGVSRNRRLTWEPTGEERPSSRPEMTREGEEGEEGEEGRKEREM